MKQYAFISNSGDGEYVRAPSGESGREDIVIYDKIEYAVKSKYFTKDNRIVIIDVVPLEVLE